MLKLQPVGVFAVMMQRHLREAQEQRHQSASPSLQVGAKDLTLQRNAFRSKGVLLTESLPGNYFIHI